MSDDLHLNPLHGRLVELETAFAFQQKLVEDLNTAVLAQSRSLQQLENQVRALKDQLNDRKPASSAKTNGESATDDEEDYGE